MILQAASRVSRPDARVFTPMANVLVLIHAFPLGVRMWDDLTVPEGWHVVTPSLPGFDGAQLPPIDSNSIDDYATSVLRQLDERGVTSFVAGGLSMGGYVTLALWRLAADRCRGLVLADTRAGPDTKQGRADRDAMLTIVTDKGPSAVADAMLSKLLGPTTRARRPEVTARVRAMIDSQAPAGIVAAIRRMRDRPDFLPMLPSVDVPTLVVVGDEDEITPPAESERMHELLPHGTLVQLPGAGHLTNIEAPDLFNLAIRAFLMSLA